MENKMLKKIMSLSLGDKIALFIPFVLLLFVFYGLTFPPGIIQSVSYKSFIAVVACTCFWAVSRIMNLQSGINFRAWWADEKTSNRSKSTVLSARIIAFAIITSFVFAFC